MNFGQNNPFKQDEDCNIQTWTGLLVALFECDIICIGDKLKTLRLALVMWLEATPSQREIHTSQDAHDVTGTGNHAHYDIIEVDRILGPEYIVPSMQMSDEEAILYVDEGEESRDFRKRPITDKEKWSRVVLAKRIGSAPQTSVHNNLFPGVSTNGYM